MRKINLLYDCDYDDVDILMVPDHVAEDIERVVMRFNHWLMDPENRKQFLAPYKGRMELSIGTKEILFMKAIRTFVKTIQQQIFNEGTGICPCAIKEDGSCRTMMR